MAKTSIGLTPAIDNPPVEVASSAASTTGTVDAAKRSAGSSAPGAPLNLKPFPSVRFEPAPTEIDGLIERATSHPMGTAFLLEGSLDAVAATFSVHAFVVDKARERLLGPQG